MSAPLTLDLAYLDVLWLQVTGTVCNIACRHCFISCDPKVRTHDMLSVETVHQSLDAAGAKGVLHSKTLRRGCPSPRTLAHSQSAKYCEV